MKKMKRHELLKQFCLFEYNDLCQHTDNGQSKKDIKNTVNMGKCLKKYCPFWKEYK